MKNNILYVIEAACLLYLINVACAMYVGVSSALTSVLAIIAGIWLLIYWGVNFDHFGREYDRKNQIDDDPPTYLVWTTVVRINFAWRQFEEGDITPIESEYEGYGVTGYRDGDHVYLTLRYPTKQACKQERWKIFGDMDGRGVDEFAALYNLEQAVKGPFAGKESN